MLKRIPILCIILLFFGFFDTSLADDPMNTTRFTHKVRKDSYRCYPNLKIKVSIARVHDNKLVNTPFGKEVGGMTVQGLKSSSPKILESPVRYDTRKDEDGYNKKVRELLVYQLSSMRCLQVVEREDINAIIREWDFSDTKYVNRGDRAPAIEMPQYIAKAFITSNDGSCKTEDDEAEAWGVKDNESAKDKVLVLLRLYDIETAYVKLFACGTGNSTADAIKSAVKDLKKHRDLLLPTVRVTTVRDNRVELDGGPDQGLSPGTKFYLVRIDGPKESTDDFDALDYVALCKVTQADVYRASAMIIKRFSGENTQKGDMVFYYFPQESW